MNINDLFGTGAANVFQGPWSQGASAGIGDVFRQQEGLAAIWQRQAPVAAIEPEEHRQMEIKSKNRDNYARWLARIMREPLQDVPFR